MPRFQTDNTATPTDSSPVSEKHHYFAFQVIDDIGSTAVFYDMYARSLDWAPANPNHQLETHHYNSRPGEHCYASIDHENKTAEITYPVGADYHSLYPNTFDTYDGYTSSSNPLVFDGAMRVNSGNALYDTVDWSWISYGRLGRFSNSVLPTPDETYVSIPNGPLTLSFDHPDLAGFLDIDIPVLSPLIIEFPLPDQAFFVNDALRWEPLQESSVATNIFVEIRWYQNNRSPSYNSIYCELEDDGLFEIPAALQNPIGDDRQLKLGLVKRTGVKQVKKGNEYFNVYTETQTRRLTTWTP